MMLSGGEMLIQSLIDEGVEFIFGYPGGAALHIYDALFEQKQLSHILVRHEQAATHAADGYARATGKPGVVLVTSGPGATNAITGIATAAMDSIPMVIISGQVASHLIGNDAFQETDMLGISRPLVKHSFQVNDSCDIPRMIKTAFYIATSGRPGPVVIDIPKNFTNPKDKHPYSYPDNIKLRSYTPTVYGNRKQVRKAAKLLLSAKRPVIYTGGGVIQGDATTELNELAKLLDFPVTNTLMGLGGFPGTSAKFLGMLGMHGYYEANMAMHYSDCILGVGVRFDDRVTNTVDKFCPGAKIIHIDVDPSSISKNIVADVPIVGRTKEVLQQLKDAVKQIMAEDGISIDKPSLESWWKRIDEWRNDHGLQHGKRYVPSTTGQRPKPQEVVEAVYKVTKGNSYVTVDVGQHQMFAAQYYLFDSPRRWINSGGLGTMGFALPAAMGVQLAYPDEIVTCVTSEGSIQMNIQELSTCSHQGLPIKIINLNNQALGMIHQWQDMQYDGRRFQATYEDSLPDFVRLVEAYGHVGICVDNYQDMYAAVERCFSEELKDKLVFLDILIDPDEHVYPMQVMPEGAMCDMWLSKTERS